jgi:hypothetical protein
MPTIAVTTARHTLNVLRHPQTSWLSREIMFGSGFALLGFVFAMLSWFKRPAFAIQRDEEAEYHGRADGIEHWATGPLHDAVFASPDGCPHVGGPKDQKGTNARTPSLHCLILR